VFGPRTDYTAKLPKLHAGDGEIVAWRKANYPANTGFTLCGDQISLLHDVLRL